MKLINWSPSVAVFFACSMSQAIADTANQNTTADLDIKTTANLEEMMVLASYTPMENSTDVERQDSEIVDAIDSDQLEKFGDADVAAAVKRVAGVSIQDDKYAVVRGLDARYISSTLNNNLMPTTDPLRRDVQMDLFPSNILGGIQIQKSYSADMPGDSTGGSIGMATKDLPDELITKLSGSLGYNFDVTGNDIVTYEGSGSDWLTYDDGLREVPSDVESTFQGSDGSVNIQTCDFDDPSCDITNERNAALSQQFPVIYNVKTESASPNWGLGVSHGNRFDKSFGSIGYYGALSLKNKTSARIDAVKDNPDEVSTYERSKKTSRLNGYFVFGLEDNHDGEWLSKTIWLRQAEDTTRVESGLSTYDDRYYDEATLRWNEREFFAQQFSGKHFFFTTHELEWRVGLSNTTMYEPDRRTWLYIGGQFLPRSTERRFSDLSEDGTDFGVSYLFPVDFSASVSTAFKAGYLYNKKDRNWKQSRYSFEPGINGMPTDRTTDVETQLSLDNLAGMNYRLAKKTDIYDTFAADVEVNAFYLNTETTIADSVTLVVGVRQEAFTQVLGYPNEPESSTTADPVDNGDIDESKALPAVSINYAIGDNWQVRASASQTLSYPGVVEKSKASLYDPDTDEQIFGNPNLVVAEIDNYDLRGEYYFEDGGSITLALFSKSITNPIEKALPDGSGSAVDGYTFRNSKSADLVGVELDFSKVLMETSSIALDLGGNVSVIESEVDLDQRSIDLEGQDAVGRKLQGQSPLLANLHFGFEHFASQQQVNLLVNYFDDKIHKVGRGAIGNTVEKGRITLDLNYSVEFVNESKIDVKLANILNEATEYETDHNSKIIESYKEGMELSVGYSYKF
ncbi:TonB-dependent receptor-like protein [Alteromonadaceae bacterium 2753L.S.0a.02]|nr:TonB-dependent receptor-like protein [Alteromonadaceae bacterium 2753L.S.0a.02]